MGDLVFSTESYCFPPSSRAFYNNYSLEGRPEDPVYRCPNTGVYAGRADFVKKFLLGMFGMDGDSASADKLSDLRGDYKSVASKDVFENDQVQLWKHLEKGTSPNDKLQEGSGKLMFDMQAEFFQSMFDYDNGRVKVTNEDGTIISEVLNKESKGRNIPLVVHYNGSAKFSNSKKVLPGLREDSLFRRNVVKEKSRADQREFEQFVSFFDSFTFKRVTSISLATICPKAFFESLY